MKNQSVLAGPEFYENTAYRKQQKIINDDVLALLITKGRIKKEYEISFKEAIEKFGLKKIMQKYKIKTSEVIEVLYNAYKRGKIDLEYIEKEFNLDRIVFLKGLAKFYNFVFMDFENTDIDYSLSKKFPSSQLELLGAIPIKEDEVNVFVAFKNPFDFNAQEKISRAFTRQIVKTVVCNPSYIQKFIAKIKLNEEIAQITDNVLSELKDSNNSSLDGSSAILELIEMILNTSIKRRASDIHIEPSETECFVRSRIDGMLTKIFVFEKEIYAPLISRLKLLSNLDIAEKRKPQDGRFTAIVDEKEYDFRISTLPVMNGESVVMRILDKSKTLISLDKLGLHPLNLKRLKDAMVMPYGIVLVTGPTGSGKTTTLYAALNYIKNITKKIITVEDPVEYQMEGLQQVQVNLKAGLTFASALRSILRQDPDIIMIGEIRDQETLRIAIQSALTGHMVFSTLHTNDAISAITRILDMGIEEYLVSGALSGIEAQRLVRRLCPHCKQKVNLSEETLNKIKDNLPEKYQFYSAVGCDKCAGSGYSGRVMISEILPISEKISSMISRNASTDEIAKVAYDEGFIDMFKDGIIHAANGETTLEEIYRVVKG